MKRSAPIRCAFFYRFEKINSSSKPIPRNNPKNVFVWAVDFIASGVSLRLPLKPLIAWIGLAILKNTIKSHGLLTPNRIIPITQIYDMANNAARSWTALSNPIKIAIVFLPPRVSSSISLILLDRLMQPIKIAIGTEIKMLCSLTKPV